ncbi:hypothetical protein HYR82_01965 [Candidatus Peregrinibacteria bacterium]|nr:hypothetical protein [Candidatus Peregrinibacteria bacterium]
MDKIEVAGKINSNIDSSQLNVDELDVFAKNLKDVEWSKLNPTEQKSLRDLHVAIEKRLAGLEKLTLKPETKNSLENLFREIVATLKRTWIPSESKLAEGLGIQNETAKSIVNGTSETTAATMGRAEQFTRDHPKIALGIMGGLTFLLLRGWNKAKEAGKKGYTKTKSAVGTAWGYFKKALFWTAGILGIAGGGYYGGKYLLDKKEERPKP